MLINYRIASGNTLIIKYLDDKCVRQTFKLKLPESEQFDWKDCSPFVANAVAWDKRPVRKIIKPEKYSIHRIREMIIDLVPDSIREQVESNNIDNIHFCDIETEILDEGKSTAANPISRVLTISVVDSKNRCYLLGSKPLSKSQIEEMRSKLDSHFEHYGDTFTLSYKHFPDEREMLHFFLFGMCSKVSIITGWNFVDYDWKFIINRAELLGIDTSSIVAPKFRANDNRTPYDFIVVDYLELVTKYERSINIKESGKLDDVADRLLNGIKKVKMESSFMEMYRNDYFNYCYYNVVDSILVYYINQISKSLLTHTLICGIPKCSFGEGFSDISKMEWAFQRAFYKKGLKVPPRPNKLEDPRGKVSGAYVAPSVIGLHYNIAVFDFSSLYPTIVSILGISPDSIVHIKDVEKIKDPENYTWSSFGCYFKKSTDGAKPVMAEIVDVNYSKRKAIQYESLELEGFHQQIVEELSKRGLG